MPESTSIAMATYNGAKFIDEQLISIVEQRCRPSEVVISDDCSSDETISIVERFAAGAPFPVIVLRNRTTLGYAANFVRAAKQCCGSLILFSDQDDIWHPYKISAVMDAYASETPAVITHDISLYSDFSKSNIQDSYYELLNNRNFSPAVCFKGCSMSVRRDAIEAWGWPPSSCSISHDFWIALLATGLGMRSYIDRPLIQHRLHDNNSSGWIANAQDLVYTPVEQLHARSDIEIMIELCIKPGRLEWTDVFIQTLEKLSNDGAAAQTIETFKSALLANDAYYAGNLPDPRP